MVEKVGLKELRKRQTGAAKSKTFYEEAEEEAEKNSALHAVHFEDIFTPPKANTDAVENDSSSKKRGKKKTVSDERQSSAWQVDLQSEIEHASDNTFASDYSATTMEDVFGPLQDRDFEVANPSLPAQEVVYDILSKGGSTMTVAKKLFLLEQLKNQAPPETPKKLANPTKKVKKKRPVSFRLTGLNLQELKHEREKKEAKKKTKKQRQLDQHLTGFVQDLPSKSLLTKARQMGADGYWKISELAKRQRESLDDFEIGLRIKIRMMRDAITIMKNLHEKETTHGSFSADKVFVDRNLEISISQEETMNTDGNDLRMQFDMLGVGLMILEVMTGKPASSFDKLQETIALELSAGFEEENYQVFEELESKCEDVEHSVKEELKMVICPPSLVELCVQSISPDRFKRPGALDAWEWIDSLLEEVIEDPIKDSPLNVLVGLLSSESFKHIVRAPMLINQKGARVEDNAEDENENENENEDDSSSIITDDSYQPPEDAHNEETSNKKSKKNTLSAFLQETDDNFGDHEEPSSKSVVDEREHPNESEVGRTRGRSLDRGYLQAKSNLQEDVLGSKVGNSTMNLIKEIWPEAERMKKQLGDAIDPEALARRFEIQDRLPVEEAVALIQRADDILKEEPNLLQLQGPVMVVGDIHGQFFDLRNMIRLGGQPGSVVGRNKDGVEVKRTYCFLGDYVDRGAFSCEVMLYLFALKVKYPENIWLLRGNHESRVVASYFGFKDECSMKYGIRLFNACAQAFQSLPIAATIQTDGGKWLCLHGGISPNVTSLHQFVEFDRFAEPSMTGFLCDILWSDPISDSFEDGVANSLGEFLSIDFLPNPVRGCSYRYGYRALIQFLAVNGLCGLIRAHEVQEEGYRYHFQEITARGNSQAQVTPPVITVFSAPNYCGRYGNKAAFIRISSDLESKAGLTGRKTTRTKKRGGFFKRKKKAEHQVRQAIRPLELIEPVQFTAVYSPEPLQFENEDRKQQVNIENVCPYMPTNFSAFIKKALELEAEETEPEKEERGSLIQVKKKRDSFAEPKPEPAPVAERPKNWKAIQMLGLDEADAAPIAPPEPLVKQKSAADLKKEKEYKDAASADSINEMNPARIREKIEKAKKMDTNNLKLPSSIRIEDEERKRRASMNKEQKISFSKNEITALQALFLLIDRRNTGKIEAQDLITWSRESGIPVADAEAEICIDYVDFDKDGAIGFGDYLAFAAKNKDLWLKNKFTEVLGQVKMLRERSGTLERSR